MTYSTFYNNNGSYSLAYYNGYVYIGSNTNSTIRKVNIADPTISSVFYTFDNKYRTTCIRIYGDIIYCSLIDSTLPNNGSISASTLTSSPGFGDVISGPDVNSFIMFDGALYYTTSDSVVSYNSGFTTLINNTDNIGGELILANPQGIQTDGYKLYFCNKNNNNVYSYDLTDNTKTKLCVLANDNNNDLVLYGKYIYICSTEAQLIQRIHLNTLVITTFETFTGSDKPNTLLMVNNELFVSSSNSNQVLTRPFLSFFNSNAMLSISGNTFTYTFNNNFTINNNWDEIGLHAGKVIIDGNNTTLTIENLNTDTLFFGGGSILANRLEIKNLTIVANINLFSPLLRAYGFVKINNCHLKMTGNMIENGGLLYNDGLSIYNPVDIIMINSSSIINGKIGSFNGALLGFFIEGCKADISNCIAIVLHNSPEMGNETIDQNGGVFVGSSVGQGYSISISNSYCIFSGSMKHSAGVIGGKYLGSSGDVTLTNFYIITNITNVVASSGPSDTDYFHYSYFLSTYGSSPFNSITATNVNFLNFNINNLKMYSTNASQFDTITNVNKYTTFNDFNAVANTEANRIGTNSYYLNYKLDGVITSYKCYYPNDNNRYEVLIGSNNKILADRLLSTIPEINKSSYDDDFNLGAESVPAATQYYTSSDDFIADVYDNIVSIYLYGTVTITIYTLCDETYSYVENYTILNISKPTEATALEDIGLTTTVIRNILSVNLSEDSKLNTVPIDFTWGLFDIPGNKTIARHNMLSILFDKNNINRFLVDNTAIGLNDIGTTEIYVYKPSNTLQILSTDINDKSVYINLFNLDDQFIFNNGSNYIISKQVSTYKIQHAPYSDIIKSDGDTYTIGSYNIIFGGSHIYSSGLPCLTEEATVLTPNGYIKIRELKQNDFIITTENRIVNITNIFSTVVKGTRNTYPYIITQSSIGKNYPPRKTLISGNHLIKYNNHWIKPNLCNKFKQDRSKQYIKYYHIETPNPETDHLIINGGLIVEAYKGKLKNKNN